MKGKNTSKILAPILLASVATSAMVTSNVRDYKVYAAPATLVSTDITVENFDKDGEVGVEYTLPTVTIEKDEVGSNHNPNDYTLEMVLTDPRGADIKSYTDDHGVTHEISNKFVPAHSGTYTLKYNAVKDGEIVASTDTMKIEISSSEYDIIMPTNSKYVILDTVKTGTTVRIPAPELTKDGETETNLTHLTVTITGEDNQVHTLTPATVPAGEEVYYSYNVVNAGVYEVEYKYEDAGVYQVVKSQRFVAKDNYDYSKIKLSMSYASTRPTSGKIGKAIELPKVNVVDTNNGSSSIKSYVEIKAYYRGTTGSSTPVEVAVEDYKFTPEWAGNYSVTYQAKITYVDASGEHTIETIKSQFEISDVKDNEAPTPKVVNDYQVEGGKVVKVASEYNPDNTVKTWVDVASTATQEELLELLGSRATSIPSIVVIPAGQESVTLAVPAIFATDNAVDGASDTMTYTRSVKDEHGTITTINKKADLTTAAKAGETAYHKFTAAGKYTLRFKAADSNLSTANSDTINYTITVVNEADYKKGTPKVTLQSFSEYTYTDTNLVFTKPTAVDESTNSEHVDARMDVVTTITLVAQKDPSTTVSSLPITLTKDDVNDEGKYELDIEELIKNAVDNDTEFDTHGITAAQVTKLTITASATNDGGATGTQKRTIELINTLDDSSPVLSTDSAAFESAIVAKNGVTSANTFEQRQKVYLPDVTFTDTIESVLSANVVVTDPNGSKVTVYNGFVDQNSITLTVKNGYFTAEYAGVYSIKYSVKDSGGNAVYALYQIEVELTETPELYLANISEFENKEYQLGQEIFPPKAGLYVNGEYLTPDDSDDDITIETSWEIAPVEWDDVKADVLGGVLESSEEGKKLKEDWELENRTVMPEVTKVNGKNVSFKAYTAGVYTIRYTGKYTVTGSLPVEVENERIVRVTVKDLTKPVIDILDNEYKSFPLYETEYVANKEVIIPGFTVTGCYDMDSVERSVEISGYDGKTITATYIKALDEYANETEIVNLVKEANPKADSESVDDYNDRIEEEVAEFKKYHTDYAGMYSFVPNGNGTHTIHYVAVDGNGNETKTDPCYVYVGDCEEPNLDFGTTDVQESIIPPTVKVGSDFELNMNELLKYVSDNKSSINNPDNKLTVTAVLRNSSNTKQENLFGNDSNRYKWNLGESGKYTLTITLKDKAGKTTTKDFTIESKAEESEESKVKEVVGVILIVLSLAILAGVIIYFVVSGRKMRPGSSKGKKAKASKK